MDSFRAKKQVKGKPISADNLSRLTKTISKISGITNKRIGQSVAFNLPKKHQQGIVYVSYSSHSGKIYSGLVIDKNLGTVSTKTVEFIFQNDDGTDDLLESGDVVSCQKAPAYIANDSTTYSWTITDRYIAVSTPSEGSEPNNVICIKYDGSRSTKRYTGHIKNDDGDLGDAVQFRFPNDSGADDLINANDHIFAIPCPTWDASNACWSGTDKKYWAILSPYSAAR